MKERGILYSAPMVRAYRAGLKTQTRRTRGLDKINEAPDEWTYEYAGGVDNAWHTFVQIGHNPDAVKSRCPYGVPGDRLWTRESWCSAHENGAFGTAFRADGGYVQGKRQHEKGPHYHFPQLGPHVKWRPSIHLPRWASRDTAELISVRPERLHSITEEDAIAEGCEESRITDDDIREAIENPMDDSKALMVALGPGTITAKCEYAQLWDEINGAGEWAKNKWVWRLEFKPLAEPKQERKSE